MKKKLKLCPFCKKKPETYTITTIRRDDETRMARCSNVKCAIWHVPIYAKAWNRRA